MGKHTQSEIPRKTKIFKLAVLDVAHPNVCGPLKEKLDDGLLCFVAFIEKPWN